MSLFSKLGDMKERASRMVNDPILLVTDEDVIQVFKLTTGRSPAVEELPLLRQAIKANINGIHDILDAAVQSVANKSAPKPVATSPVSQEQ
jgi:hypothetical protein